MSAGRKPTPPAQVHSQHMVNATLPADAALEAASNKRLQALVQTFHYDGALREDVLEDGIIFHQQRSAESIFEIGKRLLLLKELVGHGRFQDRIATLGMHYRSAARFMSIAVKFSKSDAVSLLNAAGTQKKLLELTVLDDEELQSIEAGETVGTLTLDKIEAMSHRELRDEIKKLRANVEDMDGRIKTLTDKNEATEQEVVAAKRKWRSAKPDEHHTALRAAVTDAADRVRDLLGYMVADPEVGLRGALARLFAYAEEHGIDEADFAADTVAALLNAVRWVRDHEEWPQAVPIRNDLGAEA